MDENNLKKAGLKVTTPRTKILQILESSINRHLRAEDIYRKLLQDNFDISLATVYRVLAQFTTAGIVKKHHFEDGGAVFEIDNGEHHDHIVCIKCNKVSEFYDKDIEERQDIIANKLGFPITSHTLYIFGICSECSK